jgi:hypothetical protein
MYFSDNNERPVEVPQPPVLATRVQESQIGRPSIHIDIASVHKLRMIGFKKKEIARMAGTSERTLRRRLAEMNYRPPTQASLDLAVSAIIDRFPNAGRRVVKGGLRALGLDVTESLIRDSMERVDPVAFANRIARRLPRRIRRYWVPHPNAVWHFDGHEKLARRYDHDLYNTQSYTILMNNASHRWNIYISGCVDGYSRRIMWLSAANNKKASTVHGNFKSAVRETGYVPHRIRCDKGKENSDVIYAMWRLRGLYTRTPVLTGRSVHNTRIERLWREVHRLIGERFKGIFLKLEDQGYLSVDSTVDLWCLHQVFIPYINQALREFRAMWDMHPSSSMGAKTPMREWLEGLSLMPEEGESIPDVDAFYAIDPNETPLQLQDDDDVNPNPALEDWEPDLTPEIRQELLAQFCFDVYPSDQAAAVAYIFLRENVCSIIGNI